MSLEIADGGRLGKRESRLATWGLATQGDYLYFCSVRPISHVLLVLAFCTYLAWAVWPLKRLDSRLSRQALLWRQYLLKRRSLASTIVELLSPIVLISLLVLRAPCHSQYISLDLKAITMK